MPTSQMIFGAAMAASLLVSITAMALALREPGLPWKPFWVILALVGVGGGAMVLGRADQVYWFIGVALPTASFTGLDADWHPRILQVLFPLGALLVFFRLHRHRVRGKEVGRGTS